MSIQEYYRTLKLLRLPTTLQVKTKQSQVFPWFLPSLPFLLGVPFCGWTWKHELGFCLKKKSWLWSLTWKVRIDSFLSYGEWFLRFAQRLNQLLHRTTSSPRKISLYANPCEGTIQRLFLSPSIPSAEWTSYASHVFFPCFSIWYGRPSSLWRMYAWSPCT